jgi:hypothetical protein
MCKSLLCGAFRFAFYAHLSASPRIITYHVSPLSRRSVGHAGRDCPREGARDVIAAVFLLDALSEWSSGFYWAAIFNQIKAKFLVKFSTNV